MLTLFYVVKFIKIRYLPYCIRVLSQQACVSVRTVVSSCCVNMKRTLCCSAFTWALAKPCDVGKGNEVNKITFWGMKWCYLATYFKVAFWSKKHSGGYCILTHIHWKILHSQVLTYCYWGLFFSCLDLFCLFKSYILQDGGSPQAHLSAVPVLMWVFGLTV